MYLNVHAECNARLERVAELNGLSSEAALELLVWEAAATGRILRPFAAQEPQPSTPPAANNPLVRVKAEAYEHRIYELEYAYMMSRPDTEESKGLWASCQQVKANYLSDYPNRPLNPKPRPLQEPATTSPFSSPAMAAKKPRKPYTYKTKAATPTATEKGASHE